MQISSKLLFALTVLLAAVLVFAPLTFSAESSNATVPFSDSFGSSTSNEVTNWDEDSSTGTNETKIIGSGGQTGLPNDGHARIAAGGFIRRTIDASGFDSLTLKYYYRHVSSAESSDQGFVEYCEGTSCDSSWQNLATVDIDPGNANLNDWSAQQSIALPSALDNALFRIRFRNGAGDEPEFFRIDDVEVLGTEIEGEEDTIAPTSTITSPQEGSFWNEPILISGSSTDVPDTTVDYVTLWASISGDEDWFEIAQIDNENEDEPFSWSFNWVPEEEGIYDILAEAIDMAGNGEGSPVVEEVTYDITNPVSDITYPDEGQRYIEDVWDGEIRGTATDSPSSGVREVLVSIQQDFGDGLFWDADDEEWIIGQEEEEEYLNEADFDPDSGTWTFPFDFIEPEGEDQSYTVRSHAVDNAENREDTNEGHFFFGRAPLISDESSNSATSSLVTITWTTDHPATSRVIYDTVSHPVLGDPPNYGYSSSTAEFDTDPKVTSHSVAVDGLTVGTTYSYRTVSHGSPEAVGDEKTFTTTSPAAAAASSPGPGDDGGGGAAPTCGNAKPGSAPTLTNASAGTNSGTLTWSAAADPVTYYLVTYGTSPGAQQFGNPNVGGAGTTSYTVSGLSGGATYYFKVRAGNGCAPGDFSNELSATPGGGFVASPAAGFAPGVLGATAEETTPSAKATPETKGIQEEVPIKESFLGSKVKYAVAAVIILLIVGLILWRNRKTDKSKSSI